MSDQPTVSRETAAVHAGLGDHFGGGVVSPVYLSTTYERNEDLELTGPFNYGRSGSQGALQVEAVTAELDGGSAALAFASGMGAFVACLESVSPGARVVAPTVMYHGARDWLLHLESNGRIQLDFFDATDTEDLSRSLSVRDTELVWVETLSNPSWQVADIARIASITHREGAVLAVDSTVTPPVTTQPLGLGADIVFHSATKYMNGHSDVFAGILVTDTVGERWERIAQARLLSGSILGGMESWLLLRGLRTMYLRFERASASAMVIAKHLTAIDTVGEVLYPGLSTHPGHEVAVRQMVNGFGGMLSVLMVDGQVAARRVASRVQVFHRATSLGGVESLIEHRHPIEGPNSNVAPELLRLSIGIERLEDLLADLDQALGG